MTVDYVQHRVIAADKREANWLYSIAFTEREPMTFYPYDEGHWERYLAGKLAASGPQLRSDGIVGRDAMVYDGDGKFKGFWRR